MSAPSAASVKVIGTVSVRFVPAAPEQRMRATCTDDVEVPRRPTVSPGLATALHLDALAVLDACGDANLYLALATLDARCQSTSGRDRRPWSRGPAFGAWRGRARTGPDCR